MVLLLLAAGFTVGFNFALNQYLDFETKCDPGEMINTRRSFRPMEKPAVQVEELQAVEVK